MEEGLGIGKRKLIDNIIVQNWNIRQPTDKYYSYHELLFVIQELLQAEGRKYLEGGMSLNKGFHVFREFVKYLMYRNVANFDSMVLLTSEKGLGKSSAALMIAKEWCKLLGTRFIPEKHIAYSNEQVMAAINTLPKFSPLICDESIRFAMASEWAVKSNRQLRKRLGEIRTKHFLFIMCFPLKVYKIEKNYLESYVSFWVEILARGTGAIFVKDKNPVHDAWRLSDFKDMASYTEFTALTEIEKILKRHRNFWHVIRFPKPSPELYAEYLKTREKNVYDDVDVLSAVTKEDMVNALLILTLRDIMLHDQTITMNRILLHIKQEFDIPVNKALIQMAVDDAKQLVMKMKEKSISL